MSEVIHTARALLDELNANAAAGLITREALILMGRLQRALSVVEGA